MSRVLITGASGTIGAHLAKKLLADGKEVISIRHDEAPFDTASILGIRDKITWCRGSILDERFVKRVVADYSVESIFHLAALPLVQVATRTTVPIFETNFMGAIHILEAIKENAWAGKNIRLIYYATDKVYGDAGEKPYTEEMALNGLAIYDSSKACADLVVRTYAAAGFIPSAVVIRPCNVIAPGDLNLGRVLPRLILPWMRREAPTLYRTSYLREFIAVKDLIWATLMLDQYLASDSYKGTVHGQAFNVGSSEQRSIDDVVTAVAQHFPNRLSVKWIQPPAISRVEIPFQLLNTSKLRSIIDWKPQTFSETIEDLVMWWKTNWHELPESIRNRTITDWHG